MKGGGELLKSEKDSEVSESKLQILAEAMREMQPKIADFRGKSGFSDGMLQRCEDELEAKLERVKNNDKQQLPSIGANDKYTWGAEAIVAYAFNDRQMFPTRDSFAFLASEYDDKINGTDIVVGLQMKDSSHYIAYSVDVATGTNRESIHEKFSRSARWHGKTAPWNSFIKFCAFDGQYWSESETPHFTLGLMPSRVDDALEKIKINDDGLIAGRDSDPMTDFKLLSEMREQLTMHEKSLHAQGLLDNQMGEVLRSISGAVNNRLYKILGVQGKDKIARAEDFKEKYTKMVKYCREDLVYRNILDECQIYRDEAIRRIRNGKIGRFAVGA